MARLPEGVVGRCVEEKKEKEVVELWCGEGGGQTSHDFSLSVKLMEK
jgi:hypothetical protein